tara:strand:+ start:3294 stop:3497 length:204 start_codon:yes stop_codon:yes gene_type:complete
MINLVFTYLILTIFFRYEDEEASNDTSGWSLVGNWDVNLEIFEGSSGCNGTPDESLSGTLVLLRPHS